MSGAWSRGGGFASRGGRPSCPAPSSGLPDLASMPSLPGNPPPPQSAAAPSSPSAHRPPSAQPTREAPMGRPSSAASAAAAAMSSPLPSASKHPATSQQQQQQPPVDAYIVLDFEATCDEHVKLNPQEIIEFPMVVVDPRTMSIVGEFQRYVRPVHKPKLTDFCTGLTGITQDVVDKASVFSQVAGEAMAWLRSGNFTASTASAAAAGSSRSFLFVTCGDWDLKTMLPHQLEHTALSQPFDRNLFAQWVNIKSFFNSLPANASRRHAGGMPELLRHYGLPLTGRHHSGIDDCRNIANVLLAIMHAGHFPTQPTAILTGGGGGGWRGQKQQQQQAPPPPPFVPWNGPAGPWPASSLVPPQDCPAASVFEEERLLGGKQGYAKPSKQEAASASARAASAILPNPKDFPIEYILATEPPPKFNNAQDITAMSKRLAWCLRHNAAQIGLAIDSRGFVAMDAMAAHREFRNKGSLSGFATIAQMDSKARYRIEYREQEGRFYMGATQGHSIEGIDADLAVVTAARNVPIAVHGTTHSAWALIREQGLKVMGRQHVHFASGLPGEDGVISGMRGSAAVLVYLDVGKCLADGIPLFRSQNGVILCPGVGDTGVIPPQYFAAVHDAKKRQPLT